MLNEAWRHMVFDYHLLPLFEPCPNCGFLFSASIFTVAIWIALFVAALVLVALRRFPFENMARLATSAFAFAVTGTTAILVGMLLVESLGLIAPQDWLERDVNQVYTLSLFGATIAALWALTNLSREFKSGMKAIESKPISLFSGSRIMRKDYVAIAQRWVEGTLKPTVVTSWEHVDVSNRPDGNLIVNGTALDDAGRYRYFGVVMKKSGHIIFQESRVGVT